tara:strand:- start:1853 stop:2740 length:888 start_codon:yes stop_codon:yes gene_type:complete
VFVQDGPKKRAPIPAMPGVSRLSISELKKSLSKVIELGIPAIAIFPVVEKRKKTNDGREALNPNNLICRTIRSIKKLYPNLGIISDVALDPYTSHGHDGIYYKGKIINDETVDVLTKQAIVNAEAGCDIIAPSDMMDGRVRSIRKSLDDKNFKNVKILSYAAKFSSSFYGPFRDAINASRRLGKEGKKTYQMDPANSREALREVAMDIKEGADMIMVKPGLPYLDIVKEISQNFSIPLFVYQVSGEYSMMKAADKNNWLNFPSAQLECLLAFKRAGANAIITYSAIEIAKILKRH